MVDISKKNLYKAFIILSLPVLEEIIFDLLIQEGGQEETLGLSYLKIRTTI